MTVPTEVLMMLSRIKGGLFVADNKSGEFWKCGKIIVSWTIRKGVANVVWH